jgi:hypothetical protein
VTASRAIDQKRIYHPPASEWRNWTRWQDVGDQAFIFSISLALLRIYQYCREIEA